MFRRKTAFLFLSLIALTIAAGQRWLQGGAAKAESHPIIPGYERFHAKNETGSPLGGQLLLGELNCISCHKPDTSHESFISRKQAPVLDHVADRVRISYVRKFLSDPQAVKPGTTMPKVLVDDPKRDQKIDALVHFLAAKGGPKPDRPDLRGIILGRELYSKVGCVACHGPRDGVGRQTATSAVVVPLGDLTAKYSISGLAAFLENPQRIRPSGRMPHILNAKESRDVANYLLMLSYTLGIDLSEAIRAKVAKNAVKYPVEKCRGHYRVRE